MKNKSTIFILAMGHGLNDLVAGYFLGGLVQMKFDILQTGMGLFVYNLLAFGGQYPVALWVEKYNNPKKFLINSYLLNTMAVALFIWTPHLSIVLAGVASAIYHVAGGAVCARDNKAVNIGFFAAPGVAGLIAGGYFAFTKIEIIGWLMIACVVFLLFISLLQIKDKPIKDKYLQEPNSKLILDQHDLIMILLLTIISLRSVVWNIFQLLHDHNYEWLLAIAIAACTGKILGGWLADRIGWRLYLFISLLAATPLITFCKNEILLFCIGIGLLQSGIPASTALLIQSVKGKTERGIGLSFGTAIIGGAVVLYTPFRDLLFQNFGLIFISIVMLLLLFFTIQTKTTKSPPNKSF